MESILRVTSVKEGDRMSWNYDPFKPWSEKNAADWATDYYIYEEVTKEDGSGGDGYEPPSGGGGSGSGCGVWIALLVLLLIVVGAWKACTAPQHSTTYYTTASSYTTASTYRTTYTTSSTTQYTSRYTYRTSAKVYQNEPDEDDFDGDWEDYDDYEEYD